MVQDDAPVGLLSRWYSAPTASTTPTCSGRAGLVGCWAAGSRRRRRWDVPACVHLGHVRHLDALLGQALERAWKAGAGPGDGRLVIDVDSFVGEVCGRLKQGPAYGYAGLLGYHPILANRADTRETLHIRLRKGSANTQKGIERFTDELIARVNRAGATGVKLVRADCACPSKNAGG